MRRNIIRLSTAEKRQSVSISIPSEKSLSLDVEEVSLDIIFDVITQFLVASDLSPQEVETGDEKFRKINFMIGKRNIFIQIFRFTSRGVLGVPRLDVD